MSTAQDTNNQNRVSTPDTTLNTVPAQCYPRDPNYYYDTDNAVFLVGGVLFKLPKSNLLSHMDQKPSPTAKITRSDIERPGKGAGDSDPFVIPEVTAQQFRWFLLLLLGTPADAEYRSLFVSAQSTASPTKDIFLCYQGVYATTRYFGMTELRDWSYSQLDIVLKSVTGFVNASWDKATIIQALTCAQTMDYWNCDDLCAFVNLALSTSAPNNPLTYQPPLSSNLDTCIALYKDPNLPKTYPVLFDYVFTVILSLGHRSSVWINQLTREDRNILYAAQVHLVSLGADSDLKLSWLSHPPSKNRSDFCSNSCTKDADTAWSTSFAYYGALNSDIPLVDIAKLVLLPSYRQLFADSTQSYFKSCKNGCARKPLFRIDVWIEAVFDAMCRKYQHFAE
ncbi:hypothetical protein BDV93DRAFT_525854, partial [Ceratobasidium sp. AG-I]